MNALNGWAYLAMAVVGEMGFVSLLPRTEGFQRLMPSLATVAAGLVSLVCLSRALRYMPVSLAYPLWVGGGVVAATLYGALVGSEGLTAQRGLFLMTLVISLVGLKLSEA